MFQELFSRWPKAWSQVQELSKKLFVTRLEPFNVSPKGERFPGNILVEALIKPDEDWTPMTIFDMLY